MSERLTERQPEGWGTMAAAYDRFQAPFFSRYAADALRLAGVTHGNHVLDVATGPGTLALQAARAGASVVATDFSPGMIARLQEHIASAGLTGITAEVMNGQALTLPDNAFDAAFSMFGLIFFPDRAAGFRELYRVLRPGGTAGISGWSRIPAGTLLQQAMRRALPDGHAAVTARPGLSLQDPETFAHEMREAGFSKVTIHTIMHTREFPNADAYWEVHRDSAPIWQPLTQEEQTAVHTAVIDIARAEFGDAPIKYETEARIGIGVK